MELQNIVWKIAQVLIVLGLLVIIFVDEYRLATGTKESGSVERAQVQNEYRQDSISQVINNATTIKHENHNRYITNVTNIYADTVRTADDIDSALARIYDSLYTHRFASIIEK